MNKFGRIETKVVSMKSVLLVHENWKNYFLMKIARKIRIEFNITLEMIIKKENIKNEH